MTTHRAILIAGPTASGKSAMAIELAQRHDGVVVNADSMQVYRELAIITARPGPRDLERARHELYGHVSAREHYSVARWLADVRQIVEALWQQGATPVIVGGTGLYFKALLEGLAPIPPVPAEIREHWRGQAQQLGAGGLHALLAARDPATAARLRPTDTQRLTRALEVLAATGRSLSAWQGEAGRPLLAAEQCLRLVVSPDRQQVYAGADRRLEAMIAAGALDEVARLADMRLDPALPAMRALGVPPLLAHLRGELGLAAAVAVAKRDTRHYIKRQLTWLRRNMISWNHTYTQ